MAGATQRLRGRGAELFAGPLGRALAACRQAVMGVAAMSAVLDILGRLALTNPGQGDGLQPIRDLDQIRTFLSGAGPTAMLDLPWMVFFLAICFLFHVAIGLTALAGAIILVVLTLLTDRW